MQVRYVAEHPAIYAFILGLILKMIFSTVPAKRDVEKLEARVRQLENRLPVIPNRNQENPRRD